MAKVTVPKRYEKGIGQLATLDASSVEEFRKVLGSRCSKVFSRDLAKQFAQEIGCVSQEEAISILDALLSMFPAIVGSQWERDEFISELLKIVEAANIVESQHIAQLQENLRILLSVPEIWISVKATDLALENERNLVSARILSDIRPVFEPDNNDIGAAIITYTMRLEYATAGNENQEFYVALDALDIDNLMGQLTRAKLKGEKLKSLLQMAAVPSVEGDE